MKFVKMLALFYLVSVCSLACTDKKHEVAENLPDIIEISVQELQKAIQYNSDLLLINVLQKHIYKDCSIGYPHRNIPIEKLIIKLKKVPKNRFIVLYSASYECPVSKYAFRILKKHGFKNVYVYQGGMREWYQKRLPCKGRCRAGYLKG